MHHTTAAPRRHWRLIAALAALALVAAACGDADEPADEPVDEQPADDEPEPEPDDLEDADDAEDADEPVEEAAPERSTDLDIVVTTSVIGDVVSSLVGPEDTVTVLMPIGADPHGFQASAADAAAMRDADLVISNGLMLEENLVSVLEAAQEEGVVVLSLAEQLDPIEFDWDGPGHSHGGDDDGHDDHDDHSHDDDGHDDHDDHSHDDDGHDGHDDHSHGDDGHDDHGDDGHDDHDHGPLDPHFWFDPLRMADAVQLIAAEIVALDAGVDAELWQQRADELAEEYRALDAEVAEILSVVPDDRRMLVTNHDALGYFADRYDFTVLGTVIPGDTTQAEPDPAQFAELIETVEQAQVPAVFAETIDSTRLAEQLASEVIGRGDLEVEVVEIYTGSLGEPGSGADTYPGMLRTTSQRIADALA